MVNVTVQLLYPRERTQPPLNKRLSGLQSRSGRSEEQKNLLALPGFKLRDRLARIPVAIPITLLQKPGSVYEGYVQQI
jgi:hypothetical protein